MALPAPPAGRPGDGQERRRSGRRFERAHAQDLPGLQGFPRTGEALYRAACANCHGGNGAGAPPSQVGFALPLPDFTDCDFATREPNTDWAPS